MKVGEFASNFKVWDKNGIHPGNKTKDKKKHTDDHDRDIRIALAQALNLDNSSGRCLLWVRPPPGLDSANGDPVNGGFSLRLVRGLARIAGGDLTMTKARVTLALPEL